MIAVCGIGRPSGRLNSATTAYQSARPPIVAASAKAATKPKTGWIGNNSLAVTKSASVPARTSVASALTRRSSAARAASAGAKEDVPETVMAGEYQLPSLRAKRSNKDRLPDWDCFGAQAPRNDVSPKKEGPQAASLRNTQPILK